MDIRIEVESLLISMLNVSPEEVAPEAEIINDLGADSLDCVELLIAAEERFDIDISDADAEKVITVNDAVELIKTHKD